MLSKHLFPEDKRKEYREDVVKKQKDNRIMKKPNLLTIAAIIVVLGILLGAAALRQNEKYAFKLTAQEMHTLITSENHKISVQDADKVNKFGFFMIR